MAKEERLPDEAYKPSPPNEWPEWLKTKFLDTWWDSSPGSYGHYHTLYGGIGLSMIFTILYNSPGLYENIWQAMSASYIDMMNIPTPEEILNAPRPLIGNKRLPRIEKARTLGPKQRVINTTPAPTPSAKTDEITVYSSNMQVGKCPVCQKQSWKSVV